LIRQALRQSDAFGSLKFPFISTDSMDRPETAPAGFEGISLALDIFRVPIFLLILVWVSLLILPCSFCSFIIVELEEES
jgi:hypothetical protein